jgi:hypothetical protein
MVRSHAGRGRLYRPYVEFLERRDLLDSSALASAYGQIPISFEANQGQTDPSVQFLARGSGYSLFLTSQEAVLSLSKPVTPAAAVSGAVGQPAQEEDVLRLQLVGANPAPRVAGEDLLPGITNYFIGNDPSKWRTSIPTYGKVAYQDVYPDIDLVYYGNQQQLEYDFVVQPGANPGVIRLSCQGAQKVSLDDQGNLVLQTANGDMVEQAPVVYQKGAGGRQAVAGRYVLLGQDGVGFQVGEYDTSRPLVIDPVLSYCTYFGANGYASGAAIAVDASGNAYITGYAGSASFPITSGAAQADFGGPPGDAFVAKLNATGSAMVYSTFLGGSGNDFGSAIAVDASGNAYVTGYSSSPNFPTTPGALQSTNGGSPDDAFVSKLNANGTALLYSTYLGGNGETTAAGISVDSSGNAYVIGTTYSSSFPTTPGAFQTTFGGGPDDAFVAKLNPTGTVLLYATYLGGNGNDGGFGIALDPSDNAYITGFTSSSNFPTTLGAFQATETGNTDAFMAKLNAAGSVLLYSTYLGGSVTVTGGSADTDGNAIALDRSGNVYVTGLTDTSNFPTTPGAFQASYPGGGNQTQHAYTSKFNPSGSLIYSTYLGGNGTDSGTSIAVDDMGNAYIAGYTHSSNFPTTPDALQTTFGGGVFDAFLAKLNATGTALVYSTYLGGNDIDYGLGIALDGAGNAYITGYTYSSNFPTTPGALQTTYSGGPSDAFVAKIAFPQATLTTVLPSVNPSSYGQLVTFTATVTSGGGPVTTGTVTFQESNTILAESVPLDNNGHASFQIATLTATDSPHTITAYYTDSDGVETSMGSVNQTVSRAPLLVTAEDRTKIYGQANPVFTVDYTGFVLGENASVLGGTLSFSTTATAASPVGTYGITPSGLTSGNYTLFYANGLLTITPATLVVAPSNASRQYGMANPPLTGVITGIQNGDKLTASYSTTATSTSPVGTYPITATLNDPNHKLDNYTVTLNQGTLTVTPAAPFYIVTNTADSGSGSLRAMLLSAPAGSIVQFQAGLSGTITLTSGTLSITKNLTIAGPGAGLITVSGNNKFEDFDIGPAVTATISGLTIANGTAPLYGGGIWNDGILTVRNSTVSGNSSGRRGGGVYNSASGTLTLAGSLVSGNTTADAGGGIFNVGTMTISASTFTNNGGPNPDGGAIYNQGTLSFTSSTFSGNGGVNANGGAVRNNGTLTVDSSLFSANTADTGGAIYNVSTLYITNSTLAGNSATDSSGHGGGALCNFGTGARTTVINCTVSGNTTQNQGGGLANGGGSLTLGNTLVAGNTASTGPEVAGTVTSRGHDLIGDGSGSTGLANGVHGDQVGTTANPINPLLGPLQDNGGPTASFALLPGSPAIDAGDSSVAVNVQGKALATDQRGFSRLNNGTVDIGAFEVETFVVSTLNDGGAGSLRSALANADLAGGSNILFVVNGTIALATALPDITRSVQVLGPGAGVLTVQRSLAPGMPAFRIFTVDAPQGAIQDVTVLLAGLTVSNGQSSGYGGGIANSANLTLLGMTVTGNSAAPRGGGIYNSSSGTLTLDSSLISGNSTTQGGGGVFNDGVMTVSNSTLSGNVGADPDGGAILNLGTLTVLQSTLSGNGGVNALGGAIRNDGTLTVDGSTFLNNAANSGGAIYNTATLTVVDSSTFSSNTAGTSSGNTDGAGGGIYNSGMLMLCDSTFSGNASEGFSALSGIGGGGLYNRTSGVATVQNTNFTANSGQYGGGIANDGQLTVTDCTFSKNGAGFGGGGISNTGMLTVTSSTFSSNGGFSVYSVRGGGIYNTGTLTIGGSTFDGNYAGGDDSGEGGAIYGGGLISDSTFLDNGADGWGGAIEGGTFTISGCNFSGNSCASGAGAIDCYALTISDSTITDSTSWALVSAISASYLTMTNCTVSGNGPPGENNWVIFIGGGTLSNCAIIGNSTDNGDSTLATDGNVTITNCTISDNTNSEYGAIDNGGTLTISNSSISNNSGYGVGGILNSGTLIVSNSTISDNVVTYPVTQVIIGGIANLAPSSTNATLTLLNCTLADNTGTQLYSGPGVVEVGNCIFAGDGTAPNLSVTPGFNFLSQGHNLSSDNGSGLLTGPGDLINMNPLLGPLQDNGGPTETMALLPGSPAVDAGDPNQLGTPDQRGVVRSGGVNIGAYQASATGFSVSYPGMVTTGVPFDVTVTAFDPFGQRAIGYRGTIQFSTSDTGSGVVLPAAYTFTGSDAGLHTFPAGVILVTPGQPTLSVTDTADSTIAGSATIYVSPSPPPGGGANGGTRPSSFAVVNAVRSDGIMSSERMAMFLDGSDYSLQRKAVDILFRIWQQLELPRADTALMGLDGVGQQADL